MCKHCSRHSMTDPQEAKRKAQELVRQGANRDRLVDLARGYDDGENNVAAADAVLEIANSLPR
ncbi:hypothetical protein ABGB18_42555 [Nonomuraea sp. B12E4]|uniref:hypothetical protein n=1 Tax=Nonomuraea sp. B12E4 TaxID=3153564 RepID=UPI00325EA88A